MLLSENSRERREEVTWQEVVEEGSNEDVDEPAETRRTSFLSWLEPVEGSHQSLWKITGKERARSQKESIETDDHEDEDEDSLFELELKARWQQQAKQAIS